jgi:peptidoglycan/xylan/chitin deacetylase (PgdA/CDA1 family)
MKNQTTQSKNTVLWFVLTLSIGIGVFYSFKGAEAISTNLISNPSLETPSSANPTLPDQWTTAGFGANNRVFEYPVVGINGGNAARVVITSSTDGDAKWMFNNVALTAGQSYMFQNTYMATVPTQLAIQYTSASGTTSFDPNFVTVPASPNTWATTTINFTPSPGIVAGTVFHLLNSVGSLTIDDASLTLIPPPTPFDQGFISLTFDDGLKSQLLNAKPVLDAANLKATFYAASHISGGLSNPTSMTILPDTVYTFNDEYISEGPSEVTAMVTLNDNTVVNADVVDEAGNTVGQSASFPSISNWALATADFYMPPNAKSVTIVHSSPTNATLQTRNISFGSKNNMTVQDILNLLADGQEIGAHTQTHSDLTILTTSDATTEINGSRNELLASGITPVVSFAYPYGNTNASVESIVQGAGFTSARTVTPGFNGKNTDPYALLSQSVNADTSLSQIQSWVDSAQTNKSWLILTFHDILSNTSSTPYGSTPTMLQNIADYLSTKKLPVFTVNQGLAIMNGLTIPTSTPTTTPPAPTPTSTLSSTTVTLNLKTGWNLITLPLQPTNPTSSQQISYTAETFGAFSGADAVTQWQNLSQKYISHITGVPLNDFPITAGMGFFAHLNAAKSLTITGTSISITPQLSSGWNLFGWTSNTSTTADALGNSIGNLDVVSTFDSANQQWKSHIIGLPLNNFTINPGDSIFAHRVTNLPTTTPPVAPPVSTTSTTSTVISDLPNNSVEVASTADATLPDQWNHDGWGTNMATYEYANGGHTGSRSIKLTVTNYQSGDAEWVYAAQPLARGKDYQFTAWYKTDTIPHAVVHYFKDDGSEDFFGLSDPEPDGTANWQKYSAVFNVPQDVKAVSVYFFLTNNGTVQTDDYSVLPYSYLGFDKPRVTLTFDDGFENNITTVIPVLDQYGMKSTYCISTANAEGIPENEAIIQQIANDNHEICAHTVNHPDLTATSTTAVDYELSHAQSYLQALTGQPVKDFVSPFGMYNKAVVNQIAQYYQTHRTTDEGYNSKDSFDPYRLLTQNMQTSTTLAQFQGWVNKAKADKTWLILTYHVIDTTDLTEFDTLKVDFDAQMQWLAQSGVAVQTMEQALSELKAQIGR